MSNLGGGEALHVGCLLNVLQVLLQVGDVRVNSDLVLPLELGPHLPELGLRAGRALQVVHDVDVHV